MLVKQKFVFILFLTSIIFLYTNTVSAHCDSMEGPVVKACQKALETGNINYVLIWVQAKDEQEIKNLFEKVLRVRKVEGETKDLADMYFFENVVRIHRMGEGEPYTGLKPVGYKPAEGIEAADIAIEKGSVQEILTHVNKKYYSKVNELFKTVQSKKNYSVNDVKAGREYVAAYVNFIHYVEGLFGGETKHTKH